MNISKDFKMVIVVDENLPLGLQCNTASVMSLTLGKKIEGLIGQDLKDAQDTNHVGLTKFPLPVLKAQNDKLKSIYQRAQDHQDLILIDITDAAQTTKNYKDYEEKLASTPTDQLKLLGLALAGSEKTVNKLTGNLPLLK